MSKLDTPLHTGRNKIDNADKALISIAAKFTEADKRKILNDFDGFIQSHKILPALLEERFEGVANVAWSKLATLAPEDTLHATSYREERHLAVLKNRVDRTVDLGGDPDTSRAFFEAVLNHSVQEQDKYLQHGKGKVCDAMEYLFR